MWTEITIFISLCIGKVAAIDYVSPVLIWGQKCEELSAMHRVTKYEFAKLMHPLLANVMTVVFAEENLEPSDFLCKMPNTDTSCFGHLKDVTPMTYYAQVESPYEVMSLISKTLMKYDVAQGNTLPPINTCQIGKVNLVTFNDSFAERWLKLQKHDSVIEALELKNVGCPILYMYMSITKRHYALKPRYLQRQIQITNEEKNTKGYLLYNSNVVLYYTSIHTGLIGETLSFHNLTTSPIKGNFMNVVLAADSSTLTFKMKIKDSYCEIHSINYYGKLYKVFDVSWPIQFSYYKAKLTAVNITKSPDFRTILQFVNFQIEFREHNAFWSKFADIWFDERYVTPGILMGLFVMGLLVSIAGMGILAIMDISSELRVQNPGIIISKLHTDD